MLDQNATDPKTGPVLLAEWAPTSPVHSPVQSKVTCSIVGVYAEATSFRNNRLNDFRLLKAGLWPSTGVQHSEWQSTGCIRENLFKYTNHLGK